MSETDMDMVAPHDSGSGYLERKPHVIGDEQVLRKEYFREEEYLGRTLSSMELGSGMMDLKDRWHVM